MATSAERLGTGLEFSDEFAGFGGEGEEDLPPGISPWKLAWRRLRRNKVALFFGGLFLLIVLLCLLAPVYAHDIAHIAPQAQNITGTVKVGGKAVDIVSPTGIPIGPTWHIATTSSAPTTSAATSPCGCSTAGATRSRSAPSRR